MYRYFCARFDPCKTKSKRDKVAWVSSYSRIDVVEDLPVDMLAVVECLENQDWIIEDHTYEEKIHTWTDGKNEVLRGNGIFYIPLNNSNMHNKVLTVTMEDVYNKAWDHISEY